MSGLKDLITGVGIIRLPGYGSTAPEVPEASPIQTTLPTSAYGQTIPVVWGKARVPGAYIWVPPIVTVTSSHQEYWDTITTTNSPMSCRLRFARPLVPDSTWTLRRLWSNGTLIYDASQNYRAKGLNFRFYDGRSTQGRDPTMTKEEGTNNVSAHRGYIDIVLRDFDIQGVGAPPVFEAEIIQDGGSTIQTSDFLRYAGTVTQNMLVPVWDQQKMFGLGTNEVSISSGIFLYSIAGRRQYFNFDISISGENFLQDFRYSTALDRLVYLSSFTSITPFHGRMFNASTGEDVATSTGTTASTLSACLQDISSTKALFVTFDGSEQIYSLLLNKGGTSETFEVVYSSGNSWNGYSDIQCVTPGGVVGNTVIVYFCADDDLVKVTFSTEGAFLSATVLATLPSALRYAIYDDGDLVVWTDAATVSRVNGSSGSIEYTKSVPYQIPVVFTRKLGAPDLQNFTEEFAFQSQTGGGTSYFTNLATGITRTISGGLTNSAAYFYDGATQQIISLNTFSVPRSLGFVVGDGDERLLSDFLSDLMVYGGSFDESQIEIENVDDLIQGAVIDITAGARDVARAVIEPYSIALFERSGQIVFRRALTDGSFAVDQTIASAGDIVDQ